MCARCADLEERVAWLERELGMVRDIERHHRFRRAARLIPSTAEVVLRLYDAAGGVVTNAQILEMLPSGRLEKDVLTNLTKVHMCRARRALGRDVVETQWGVGYRMTPQGRARVRAILAEGKTDG